MAEAGAVGAGRLGIEALLRVFQTWSTAVFVEDLSGTVLGMNPAAERLYGVSSAEWRGRSIADVLPEETAGLLPAAQRSLEERGSFRLEAWQRRADGKRFLAEVEGAVAGDGGPESLLVVTVRDVTAERRERADLAERAKEMENLLHAIAHDLRTPLGNLKGFASLLDRELIRAEGRPRDFLNRVLEHAGRLDGLLGDLLEFARVGRGGQDLVRDVDLEGCALAAWRDLGNQVAQAEGAIQVSGPLGRVRMAPVRLHQVLTNLFANALKYRREGVPAQLTLREVEVEAQWNAAPGSRCFVVEDNGMGIPDEEQEVVFDLFRQGSLRREGSGVGLAIVRRIVESIGGRIWVESCPGEGSCFYLVLPGTREEP